VKEEKVLIYQLEEGVRGEFIISPSDDIEEEVSRFKRTGEIHIYDLPTGEMKVYKPLRIHVSAVTEYIRRKDLNLKRKLIGVFAPSIDMGMTSFINFYEGKHVIAKGANEIETDTANYRFISSEVGARGLRLDKAYVHNEINVGFLNNYIYPTLIANEDLKERIQFFD
jgi:hypothetical protein